jgi:hypothetical protein
MAQPQMLRGIHTYTLNIVEAEFARLTFPSLSHSLPPSDASPSRLRHLHTTRRINALETCSSGAHLVLPPCVCVCVCLCSCKSNRI